MRGRHPTYEVNTDGGNVALGVSVVCESKQQTRLSDTGITDQEELEEIVVSAEDLYERHVLRGSLSGGRRRRWRCDKVLGDWGKLYSAAEDQYVVYT